MKRAFLLGVGIVITVLTAFYPTRTYGDGPSLSSSIGIGFSIGPITVSLLEFSIPLPWFLSRGWRDGAGAGRTSNVPAVRAYVDPGWRTRTTSSIPSGPEPMIVQVETSSAVPKDVLQLRFGLLPDEDIFIAPNGQRLEIETDGQIRLVHSSPSVSMVVHYDDRITVRVGGSSQDVAEIQFANGSLFISHDNTQETLRALSLIFGQTLSSCCLKAPTSKREDH